MKLTTIGAALGLVALTGYLTGCGGSGSGSTLTGASATSRATVILTDSFREDFGHVWATIYHVELTPQTGGAAVVLFDAPAGRQIDLKTLRDASGARYAFLANATIPSGTYTGIKTTIGATLQLFKSGVASGNPIPVDSTLPTDTSGHPVVTLTFRSPKTLGAGNSNLLVDFDLAHFILANNKITPSLAEGDGAGLNDPARHEQDDYRGTVTSLTGVAPALTFTLNRGNNMTVTVTTTAATALFGTTALANGDAVCVTGTLDPTTQALVATQVQTRPVGDSPNEGANHPPLVDGAATSVNASAGTFTLATTRVHGFTPSQTTVKVVTTGSTTLRVDAGATAIAADFFAALAASTSMEVAAEGTYDATTNTLTATHLRLIDPTKNGGWEHDPHGFRGDKGAAGWGNGTTPPPGPGH